MKRSSASFSRFAAVFHTSPTSARPMPRRATMNSTGRYVKPRLRVVAHDACPSLQQKLRTIYSDASSIGSLVEVRVFTEVLPPSRTNEHCIARLQRHALMPRRLRQHVARDPEAAAKRYGTVVDEARDVQQYTAIDEQLRRIVRDVELLAHAAAANPAAVARCLGGIDAAVEK